MATGNFNNCLALILREEGGLVDNPKDPGGITNLGVTLPTLQTYFGKNRLATPQDIKDLTVATVTPIYMIFWNGCHAEFLPLGIDLAVMDWCVNSGVRRGVEELQKVLGVAVDGLCGPITIQKAIATNADQLLAAYATARDDFYRSLSDFEEFGDGWLARVFRITGEAKKMADHP